LPAAQLAGYSTVEFIRNYQGNWEEANHAVALIGAAPASLSEVRSAIPT
jgi:hypothetical protein